MYEFYKLRRTEEIDYNIKKDLARSDPGNIHWKNKEVESNPLFNVLNAYASYDPDIGYCQGMNVVVSWILKFTRSATEEVIEKVVQEIITELPEMAKHNYGNYMF